MEKLKLSEVLERSKIHLIVDFITKLPLVVGKNEILVIYNRLSKILHFVVVIEETLVEKLARLFKDNMWKLHRLLKSMVLDRRLQFTAKLIKKLNKMLGIETKLLILFYSQTDS